MVRVGSQVTHCSGTRKVLKLCRACRSDPRGWKGAKSARTPRSPTGDDTATATAMSGAASIAQEMAIIKVEGVGARAEVRRCYIVYTVNICWELCASFGKSLTVGTV
jgi:hypothetical protein